MVKIPSRGKDIVGDELMKALNEIMAPYQENNMEDCPEEFLEFNDTEDEEKQKWETETTDVWYPKGNCIDLSQEQYDSLDSNGSLSVQDHQCGMELPKDGERRTFHYYDEDEGRWSKSIYGIVSNVDKSREDKRLAHSFDIEKIEPPKEIPLKEKYPTFDEYMKDYVGYKSRDKKTGRYGYWENPNAKWDCWQLGGRWAGSLRVKSGIEPMQGGPSLLMEDFEYKSQASDIAKMKDIDFDAMNADVQQKAGEFYDKLERLRKIKAGEIPEGKGDAFLGFETGTTAVEHGIAHYEGKGKKAKFIIDVPRDEFMRDYAHIFEFKTWAVLDSDGWHEKAKMGWWAFHDGTTEQLNEYERSFYKRFLENEDPETYIAICDCHI
jgi:hypothetical protein